MEGILDKDDVFDAIEYELDSQSCLLGQPTMFRIEFGPEQLRKFATLIARHEGRLFIEKLVGEMNGTVTWKEEKDAGR
jgi:hypothetical protein